jgi:type IV pilus assembly protein PilW
VKRTHSPLPGLSSRHRAAGFSLVELMVAMLLSLLLSAAALGVFVSNKRVYGATEGLGRIQENARMAFELMSRDIRGAGGNPCDVRMKVVNVLSDATNWWATYGAGISGFDDGGHSDSAPGTDAIRIQFFEDADVKTSGDMANATGELPVNDSSSITDRQIMLVCGFFPSTTTEPVTDTAAIFSAGTTAGTITHAQAMGNARDDFSDAAHPVSVVFPTGSVVGTMRAMEWYVADNSDGGTSLYRRQLRYPGTAPELGDPEEVVPDVTDMELTYLENGVWTTGLPGGWNNVTAVQVALNLQARDSRAGGVEGELITRQLVHVIALRNKL